MRQPSCAIALCDKEEEQLRRCSTYLLELSVNVLEATLQTDRDRTIN
jgi:hypothetical protein